MSRRIASLRIARREAWRHRGRSLLVIVMIGLPVSVIVFGDVAFRTLQLEPEQRVTTEIGDAADAYVSVPSSRVVVNAPPAAEAGEWIGKRLPEPLPSLAELVPQATGSLLTRFRYGGGSSVPVVANERREYPSIRELDYTDPLAAGMVEQLDGHAPASPSEVVLTKELASTLGVDIGDAITVADVEYDVVGIVQLVYGVDWTQVIGDVGSFEHVPFPRQNVGSGAGWLLAVPDGLDYESWKEINSQGSGVISRHVAENPIDSCSKEIPTQVRTCGELFNALDGEDVAEVAALTGLLIVMGLLQVVLLVGPAFAIGRRTQERDLALVSAVGGDAKAVRRIVLSSGLVLGLAGGVAGLVSGVVAFWVLRPVVAGFADQRLFATDLRPELLVVLVVATATGLAAAWLPARAASRHDVVAALSGRRSRVRAHRGLPIAGALALLTGIAVAVLGTSPGEMAPLLIGAVISELGLIAMTPWLVGCVAALAPRLSLAPRLAVRDAGRNRLRTATAVSAVLAAVAGATALSIYVGSDSANQARHHTPTVPEDYVALTVERGEWPGGDISRVLDALPEQEVVPMVAKTGPSCIFQRCGDWKVERQANPCTDGTGDCGSYSFGSAWEEWMVGDDLTYQALTGSEANASVLSMLDSGGIVVATEFASSFVNDDTMTFTHRDTGESVDVPATVAPRSEVGESPRFELLLSEQASRRLELDQRPLGYTVIPERTPTAGELAAARQEIVTLSDVGVVNVGTPFQPQTQLPLMILLAAAVVLAVAATTTAAALANTDSTPDLATLAAIGASPRVRRTLSAARATVISVMGTGLGIAAGLVIGVAAIGGTSDNFGMYLVAPAEPTLPLTVPWSAIGLLALVVPAVAIVVSFASTRSRLPMVRRFR